MLFLKTNQALAEQFDFSEEQWSDGLYEDLDGEWHFFEKQLLSPNEVRNGIKQNSSHIISIPTAFKSHTGDINSYGTYSTTIKIPDAYIGEILSLYIPYQYSAYSLYIDNKKVAENGVVGADIGSHDAAMYPKIAYFSAESNEILLTMQISSFNHIRGGFENSIYFGTVTTVTERFNQNLITTLFINGCVFIIGLFMALFGVYRRKEYVFLIFGLFAMLISVRSMFTDPFYYKLVFLNMSWLWGTRLEYILTEASSMFYVFLMWKWHEKEFSKKLLYGLVAIHISLIIITLFTTPVIFQNIFFNVFYLAIPIFIYFIYVIYKGIRNQNRIAKTNLFGIAIIFIAFFNDFAIGQGWYNSVNLMLPAVAIYVMIHVLLMSKDFSDRTYKTEKQNIELMDLNNSNRALNIKLQKEIKRKDDFLANTSHELRNPLHGIINISHSLLRNYDTQLTEKVKKDISLQLSIGQHMSQTLKDLLDIVLLKDGDIKLQLQRIDIHALSIGVIDMLKVLIENRDVEINIDIPDDFPHVIGDENRLIQILFNLIHNAIKFTDKGTITISAYVEDNYAHIHVKDTGIGMDESTVQSIFEPYEKAETTIANFEGGIGLGLTISKQLVEKHEGSMFVQSILGEGSIFIFTIPIALSSFQSGPVVQEAKIEPKKLLLNEQHTVFSNEKIDVLNRIVSKVNRPRILAVDDDNINLKLLKNILSEKKYYIKTATSAKEALNLIESEGWDLVITDVMMPSMSGYELTQSIRKKFSISELPILLLTARGHSEDIYTGFLSGANDYVIKPVDAIELNARVHALTDVQYSINQRLQMEAAWLQAQMNPHFLLNTLNAIVSLSEINPDKMTQLIEQFAQYLQSSYYLKNVDSQISIKEEFKLVKAYLYIEKVRFGDRLQIKLNLDGFKNIMVPPLSIQTLVENAVNHGILKKSSGGQVIIQTENKDEITTITIIDDGVGMDDEQINEIFNNRSSELNGIGILNTDKRLKRLYGKGLMVTSKPQVGTTISFEVPKN